MVALRRQFSYGGKRSVCVGIGLRGQRSLLDRHDAVITLSVLDHWLDEHVVM